MKELERIIIGACYGEEQYQKVAFLEPNDFTNRNYRIFFKHIQLANGNIAQLMKNLQDDNQGVLAHILHLTTLLGANNITRFGVKLLEIRLETLFQDLLVNLSINTKNPLESKILGEILLVNSNKNSDFFQVSDHVLNYLGAHASDHTTKRIKDFLSYRDKRVEDVKKVNNGN